MVVVVDDEDRENEGDLTVAAEKVTAQIINFMAAEGRGLVCLALTGDHCDKPGLPMMCRVNTSNFGTAFCESIDSRYGTTTGISAHDRSRTILQAVDPSCRPSDLCRPGHVFPLRARDGGVLERRGQTEAAVDLARLAGLTPAGVICEVMNRDGTMARVPDLERFCRKYDLLMTSVAKLVRYRLQRESSVKRSTERVIDTEFGGFRTTLYTSTVDSARHLAVIRGDLHTDNLIPVHVHSRCSYGEALASVECDCGRTMRDALRSMAEANCGILLYLYESGRPSDGDPAGPDECSRFSAPMHVGRHILADLGVRRIRVTSPGRQASELLDTLGIEIIEHVSAAT